MNQLAEMATGYDATPAQLALAWVLAKGEFIVPIPGASKITHLEQNCAATTIQLHSADISALDALFDPQQIQGERYNATEFVLVDR